jgi:hypothetical protein
MVEKNALLVSPAQNEHILYVEVGIVSDNNGVSIFGVVMVKV